MRRALPAALALLAALAGCASGRGETTAPTIPQASATTTPTTTATTTTTATQASPQPSAPTPPPPPPERAEVAIQGNAFVNATVEVRAGGTVRWTHRDGTTPHSVAADDGSFASGGGLPCPGPGCMTSLAGATYEHRFDAAGRFPYHCEVHPNMRGTVVVPA